MSTYELVRWWRSAEPDRFRKIGGIIEVRCGLGWNIVPMKNLKHSKDSIMAGIGREFLRAPLEKAIEARGWNWRLLHIGPDRYQAEIYTHTGDLPNHAGVASHPLEALLVAYREALEHQGQQDRIGALTGKPVTND